MATDVKKHTTFAAGEVPKRQVSGGAGLADMVLSINDVIPCANATEQAQIGSGLATTAYPVGPSRPLATVRADARPLHQLEVSRDGTTFVPQSGVLLFLSDAARDAWTSTNSSLLSFGDHCVSAGLDGFWDGSKWIQDSNYAITPITLAGTFAHYTSGGWSGVQVARRGRVVYLNGPVVNPSAWAANDTVGTLATGYRPAAKVAGAGGINGTTYAEVAIAATGAVTVNAAASGGSSLMIQAAFLV